LISIDWRDVRLVVFDMDGTLYDQAPLRRAMAVELGKHSLVQRSLKTVKILRQFRQVRELLGHLQVNDFAQEQYVRTAQLCRLPEPEVRAVVTDWIEQRPLALLPKFRAKGIDIAFDSLARLDCITAIWSDYPVREKAMALRVQADILISSSDEGVGRLKPHPAGLEHLLRCTGTRAEETLVIGDRIDRDAASAEAVGAKVLIRSRKKHPNLPTFWNFDEILFPDLSVNHYHD
jgi:FMN phosphatase YigB (HAD superfamily)